MKKLEEEKKQDFRELEARILVGLCSNSLLMRSVGRAEVVELSINTAEEFFTQIERRENVTGK